MDRQSLFSERAQSTFAESQNVASSSDEEDIATGLQVDKWVEPGSDEEPTEFDVGKAWDMLFKIRTCQTVMLEERVQESLGIRVGIHVSQEFPWKQVQYKYFRDYVLDDMESEFVQDMLEAFANYNPNCHILIGYAPLLTQNQDDPPPGDPFIFFIDSEDTRKAMAIIQNIETYESWSIKRRLLKKPRPWESLGSEYEVNVTLPQSFLEPTEVEIQSTYPPTKPSESAMGFRNVDDVRDGYVELLPSDLVKFENIVKKRVTVAVQSAPEVVDLAQQTDPPFPSNQWAQYFYDVDENDLELDESSEEDEKTTRTQTPKPEGEKPPKPPLELSGRIKFLLKTLEFNKIDVYRNDYPLITSKQITRYTNPYLEETLCFANISKSDKRFVCGVDWYPVLAGLIVASYTFSTPVTIDSVSYKPNVLQRAVLEDHPILMWSFNDNLNYKLEFESPLEVTVLSFCPHHYDLLLGGTSNGQIIFWDLQGRAEKLDFEEILTAAQANYREIIAECTNWAIPINETQIVAPATITDLENSHKGAITGIYWMGTSFYVNSFGKLYKNTGDATRYKYFITCAMDGTIAFWNLEAMGERKGQSGQTRQAMPKALTQNLTVYKNKVLKPVFRISFRQPISSLMVACSSFHTWTKDSPKGRNKDKANFRITMEAVEPDDMEQSLIVSTYYGRIEGLNWLGVYSDSEVEQISISTSFARVHDGPITMMKKSPFLPNIFISLGRNVFAVWKDTYSYSPIFWRKRPCHLTTVAWSENRPGVFFLTRIDGNLEVWDILARDDDACFDDILGGGIITAISEHRPTKPEKLLGIGDYNSSFRMVKLPDSFYEPVGNEKELVQEYIKKEISRKKSIQSWETKFYESNKDIIEAKRQAEIEQRKEQERIEKEEAIKAHRKAMEEEQKNEKAADQRLTYTERMRIEWDQLNLRRLLNILMSRKQKDAKQLERETALEKSHLAYEAAKKASYEQVLQRVDEELAGIRARILPFEKPNQERNAMISSNVRYLMNHAHSYKRIASDANNIMSEFPEFDAVDYLEFLNRGENRRNLLNKTLGGNTERMMWYEQEKSEGNLGEGNWGYDFYLNTELGGEEDDHQMAEQKAGMSDSTSGIVEGSSELGE